MRVERASFGRRFEVEPLQDAVALDVGVDDGGNAGVLEALGHLLGRQLRRFRPAFDRHLAALGVDADGDAARILDAGAAHQVGVAHGDGAEDDAGDAAVEPLLDGAHVADAAAELHGNGDGLEDRVDRVAVDRRAGEGAVEIDEVQVGETLVLEGARLRRRVVVEDGGGFHVAQLQAHALAVLQVDGGKEDHGCCLVFAVAACASPQTIAISSLLLSAIEI